MPILKYYISMCKAWAICYYLGFLSLQIIFELYPHAGLGVIDRVSYINGEDIL